MFARVSEGVSVLEMRVVQGSIMPIMLVSF